MKQFLLLVMLLLLTATIVEAKTSSGGRGGTRNGTRQTAPITPPVNLTPSEAAAKAVLDSMANKLNQAEGIKFDAIISYPSVSGNNVVLKSLFASFTVERDTKFLIQSSNAGQVQDVLASSGTHFTLYDAGSNTYVRITTSPDSASLGQALQLAGKQVFPKSTDESIGIMYALGFPQIFLSKRYDATNLPVGYTLVYSSNTSTNADGRQVALVTQSLTSPRSGSIAATYTIDSVTGLPVSFTQTNTPTSGPTTTDLQETFKNLKLIRDPLPDSTYTYTPPSGAVQAKPAQ